MAPSAAYWIDALQLIPHVEGGAYRQTYQSGLIIPQIYLPTGFNGARPIATTIYFLLQKGQYSAMHRIASDELWHFYAGDPLVVYEIEAGGRLTEHLLGNNPANNEAFQCVVKAGSWFGARPKDGSNYALVGCTVSPGFDFADFAMADRDTLLQSYPQYAVVIKTLTRQ